jgi:thiamine-phosphate pyrophosphorylase
MLGRSALIGVSVHGIAEVEKLDAMDVDYAIAGPTFETQSKPGYGPILGLGGIAAMARVSPVAVIAIGGIEAEHVGDVIRSGAAGVAVMGGVMRSGLPGDAMKSLLDALRSSGVAERQAQRPR